VLGRAVPLPKRPILAAVKKPPSRLKKVLRELQLVLSIGTVTLITYAFVTSSLALSLRLPQLESPTAQRLLGAALTLVPLLLLAPGICFLARLAIELHPWRLGVGTVAFVEGALLLLRWETGALELSGLDLGFVFQLALVILAAVLAGLAARSAARRMAAREAAQPLPAAPPVADLAEQMRQAQQAEQERAAPKPEVSGQGS